MLPSLIELLNHIQKEAIYLEKSTQSLTQATFLADEHLSRAFLRSLEIIGEATKKLPLEFRQAYPQIQWKNMAGLRDKLIHDYFGVDYDLIWDILTDNIPELNKNITWIIDDVKNGGYTPKI